MRLFVYCMLSIAFLLAASVLDMVGLEYLMLKDLSHWVIYQPEFKRGIFAVACLVGGFSMVFHMIDCLLKIKDYKKG